jgi:hypothetical protein
MILSGSAKEVEAIIKEIAVLIGYLLKGNYFAWQKSKN